MKMVENFRRNEGAIFDAISSAIARGCLKLSVGGPQACKVTHNWEFSEQSIAEEWDATAFGTLCIAHLVP